MDNYIDLINFSNYSIGSGMLSIDEIVNHAKKNKRTYAALTDTNTLSGVPAFIEKCNNANIKPIIGVTLSTSHKGKYIGELTLISKNPEGFQELKDIVSSLGAFNNDLHRTIELETILDKSKNMLIIDGAKNSIIYNVESPEEYLDIFTLIKSKMKSSFVGTIQTQVNDSKTNEIARKLFSAISKTSDICKTSVFFSNNNRFANKSDYPFQANKMHEFSHLSKSLTKKQDILPEGIIDKTDMLLPLSYIEGKLSKYKTEKTANFYLSESIVNQIKSPSIFKKPAFPKLSKNETLEDIIKEKWVDFQKTIKVEDKKKYLQQLKTELALFEKLNFSDYFVVINSIAKNAQKVGYITAIRGSGAASLVVHTLGLSPIDPIEHNLMFGRFMNEGRVEEPDLDIESSHNEEMIEMLKEDYGSSNVANLMAHDTLSNANVTTSFVINAMRRYSDQSFEFQKKINRVENMIKTKLSWFINTPNVKVPKLIDLLNPKDPSKDYNRWVEDYNKDSDFKYIIDAALRVGGQIKNKKLSIGTVILSNEPVHNTLSTFDNTSEVGSDYIIEVGKKYIQKMGHLKMDILSSVILYKLNETAKMANVEVNDLIKDMTDPKVYAAISKGLISHVNQIASRMQLEEDVEKNPKLRQGIGAQMCKEIQPTSYKELTAIMALIRMGEENAEGEKPEQYAKYIEGKNNPEGIIYKHEKLIPILSDTYGALIFEEQIMRVSKAIANFTDTEADNLRSVIKKKEVEELKKIRPNFIQGALNNGISLDVAEDIYIDIENKMGQYQFNEAHACVYAGIAYQQMYMKIYHPAEFYSQHYDADMVRIYEHEIAELGFFVQRPDINNSTEKEQTIYKVSDNNNEQVILDFSLKRIISDASILNDILEDRNSYGYFEDLIDYTERVLPIYTDCQLMSLEMNKTSKINRFKKDTLNLIKLGAFDKCYFGENVEIDISRGIMVDNLDKIIEMVKNPQISQEIKISIPEKPLTMEELKSLETQFLTVSPLAMRERIEKKYVQLKKNSKSPSFG